MHIMYRKGNIMKVKNVSLENKVILVTGAAGFIGSNLVMELLREVHPVHIVGIDNMNKYYDVSIKEYRLNQIEELVGKQEGSTWKFIKGSIADKVLINQIFAEDNAGSCCKSRKLRQGYATQLQIQMYILSPI